MPGVPMTATSKKIDKQKLGIFVRNDLWTGFGEMSKKLDYKVSELLELILEQLLEAEESPDGGYTINLKLLTKEMRRMSPKDKKALEKASPQFMKAWELMQNAIREDNDLGWVHCSKKETIRLVETLLIMLKGGE